MEELEDSSRLLPRDNCQNSLMPAAWLSLSNTEKGVANEVKRWFSSLTVLQSIQGWTKHKRGDKILYKVLVDLILHRIRLFVQLSSRKNSLLVVSQTKHCVR